MELDRRSTVPSRDGYSWAYSDGTATLMTETVTAVRVRCIELHLERSEQLAAQAAAAKGAKIHEGDSVDEPIVGSVVDALGVRLRGRAPSRTQLA